MKKFIAIISIVFTFISFPLCLLYKLGSVTYIDKFFAGQMIPLMGTMLALNFALIASLQIFIRGLENLYEENSFSATKNEINTNIVALLIIFILTFMLQCIDFKMPKLLFYIIMMSKFTLFFLYIYAIYDISSALFKTARKK